MTDITRDVVADIDSKLTNAVEMRRLASDAEVEHYRRTAQAGALVESWDHEVDDLLNARRSLSAPADPDAVREAWATFAPDENPPDLARAIRAVMTLLEMFPPRASVEMLPGLIQDEHGCWVADTDDPAWAKCPDARIGCEVAW